MAPRTSHKNNENIPVNSILSVGGQPDYAQRYPSNKKTTGGAVESEHSKSAQQHGGSNSIESDSAAAVILWSSNSSGNAARGMGGVAVGAGRVSRSYSALSKVVCSTGSRWRARMVTSAERWPGGICHLRDAA